MTKENIKNKNIESQELPADEISGVKEDPEGTVTEKKESTEEHDDRRKKHKKDKKETLIEELGEKLIDLTDKHLRLQAEFDNYRKRTIREKADLIKSGGESVLVNILPVVDDFERAIATMKNIPEEDVVKQGILLIYNKFRDFMKQNNLREIEALKKDFDVDVYEAFIKIPVLDESLKGKVVDVV